MEMPQSGERFRGRENMRAFQEAHPTPPSSLQVRRVLVKGGLWVVEGVIEYGDGRVLDVVVVISELKDGKMWRDRWYFAEPFEAPEWRARWSIGWRPEHEDAECWTFLWQRAYAPA